MNSESINNPKGFAREFNREFRREILLQKVFVKFLKGLLCQSILPASIALAQGVGAPVAVVNTSTTNISAEAQSAPAKDLSVSLSLESSSNFYKEDSPDRENSSSFTISPSYTINQNHSLAGEFAVNRDEVKGGESSVSNTSISLSQKLGSLNRDISAKASLGGVLPTNETDRKEKSYQGSVSLGGSLKGEFKLATINYSLKGTRNIHEFTQSSDGSSNVQYSITNALSADFEFAKVWTLSLSGIAKVGWVYQGSTRQSYGNEIALSNQISKSIALSAGLRNDGAAFKADGSTSNVKIYDQNTTVFFASLNITQ